MKIKKEGEIITLTESDIKRIVEKKLSLEEGLRSTLKGVGGMFKSKMSNISYDRLSTHVKDALDAYQMVIDVNDVIIEDLDFSVSNNREDERSVDNVEPQFDRGK